MAMSHLLLSPSILLAAGEDGYLAYDVDLNRLHRLNPTASLLVELCDGTRSRAEILAAVAPLLPDEGATNCSDWLDRALGEKLILGDAAASSRTPLTATELREMATRLRGQDRVLAAYICQQRAAELAPDDPQQWYALGELSHIVGRRDEARIAYERYQAFRPDDVEVEHLLTALRDASPPPRASDEYIEQLYSYFASFYDENMCGDLDYRAPDLLNAAINAALGERRDLSVLELGCGTGLFGRLIRPRARRLVGIDLSAAMVERARERAVYDHLETAEITVWLSRPVAEPFDVIAICDTLIYFGDLGQVLPGAARHLTAGGILGFTVERGEDFPYRLTDSGRFAHHVDHVKEAAERAGFQTLSQSAEILRYEYGVPVAGWVTVLGR